MIKAFFEKDKLQPMGELDYNFFLPEPFTCQEAVEYYGEYPLLPDLLKNLKLCLHLAQSEQVHEEGCCAIDKWEEIGHQIEKITEQSEIELLD